MDALHLLPFEVAKKAYVRTTHCHVGKQGDLLTCRIRQDSGNAKPCIATTLLDGLEKSANKEEYEDMVINVTAMAYQGMPSFLANIRIKILILLLAGTDTVRLRSLLL